MRNVLRALLPFVTTVVLFLVLFNNFNGGHLILAALVVLNLLVLVVPAYGTSGDIRSDSPKVVAICCTAALATMLAIESFFPVLMPREYSQIRELTKHLVDEDAPPPAGASIVFTNTDQKRRDTGQIRKGYDGGTREWHTPGGRFAYYGYDPNLGARYVNLFHWNSHGYYDHDYCGEQFGDVRRIVIIGDSYVEAVQVPLSRSFHKLVEKTLNESSARFGGSNVQVVALGNSGTGQVEHLKVLESRAMEYKPDAVVFALSSNDFCDDDPGLKRDLVLASGTVTPLIRRLAAHGYYALAFAVRRMDDLQRNRIGICPELLQWSQEDIPRVEAGWERTLNAILEALDFCKARGMGFLLVYLGSDLEVKHAVDPAGTVARLRAMGGPHAQVKWDLTKSIRRVDSFCREHGVPVISLLEPLSEAQRTTGQQVFGDHYTMFGHEVAAQVLSCALQPAVASGALEARALSQCTVLDLGRRAAPLGVVSIPETRPVAKVVPASSRGLETR
ncbi:MAG: SGNH/GDSL hydrolase family protein [Desulfomonilaceae bacterium]|nr:SGNH/GDSL hydrolase family protein [Desulfomonilaceae bacterium]